MYVKVGDFLKKKYLEELYLFGLLVSALIFWKFNYAVGLIIFSCLIFVLLIIFNNIKLTIPVLLNMLFLPSLFLNEDADIKFMVIGGIIVVLSLITYMIKNKCIPKKGFFLVSYILLAISACISFFFCNMKSNPMSFVTFASVLYLLIYLYFSSTIKENLIPWLCNVALYIGILMVGELVLATLSIPNWWQSFNDMTQRLGWGMCNDAAMMIIVVAPLGFYKFIKEPVVKDKIFTLVKLFILFLGIIISNSRGGYLFGIPMFGLLAVYAIVKMDASKKTKQIIIATCVSCVILFVTILLIEGSFINQLIEKWQSEGLNDAGRFNLYRDSWREFKKSPIFGSSMLITIAEDGKYIVYHSTFFEALAAFGIVGVVFLGYFFFKKYQFLFKNKGKLSTILIIGFIFLDAYSMIDNTYILLGFCIYLAILLPALEYGINEENNNLEAPLEQEVIEQQIAL